MPNSKFDAKSFNPEAFKYMVGRIPNLKMNELRKSRAIAGNPDIKSVFSNQDGTGYARIAMRGLLDGDVVNYDGQTDITATSTKTYEQGVVVIGRAKGWIERDFSYDITGGVDFMENIAAQVAEYWEAVDQDTILDILTGVFAMTGAKNLEFVNGHTHDISTAGDGLMTATTLNTACNKACGANKKKFTLVFMHSDVSTNLENMRVLEYLKYTDKDGVTRDLAIATWNGKTVIIDDSLPVESGYYAAESSDVGAVKVVASGATDGQINLATVNAATFKPSGIAADDYVVAGVRYISFVMGNGALAYENIGAKVPYEMHRDPKTNGGQDTLYTRQRKCFSPFGISYEKTNQVTNSPTSAELKNGANWALVHSGESSVNQRSFINHKAIPIARIMSRG